MLVLQHQLLCILFLSPRVYIPLKHQSAGTGSYLYLRCWMVPKHLKVPLTMMASRVQSASHSSILVEKKKYDLLFSQLVFHVYEQQIVVYIIEFGDVSRGGELCLLRCVCSGTNLCDVSTTALPSCITLMMAFHRKRRE